jgi:hypothetical protein
MIIPSKKLFGARLSYVLGQLGIKQVELGRRLKAQYHHCDVSKSLVSRWISGERDPVPYLKEIVEVLKGDLKNFFNTASSSRDHGLVLSP